MPPVAAFGSESQSQAALEPSSTGRRSRSQASLPAGEVAQALALASVT